MCQVLAGFLGVLESKARVLVFVRLLDSSSSLDSSVRLVFDKHFNEYFLGVFISNHALDSRSLTL